MDRRCQRLSMFVCTVRRYQQPTKTSYMKKLRNASSEPDGLPTPHLACVLRCHMDLTAQHGQSDCFHPDTTHGTAIGLIRPRVGARGSMGRQSYGSPMGRAWVSNMLHMLRMLLCDRICFTQCFSVSLQHAAVGL